MPKFKYLISFLRIYKFNLHFPIALDRQRYIQLIYGKDECQLDATLTVY